MLWVLARSTSERSSARMQSKRRWLPAWQRIELVSCCLDRGMSRREAASWRRVSVATVRCLGSIAIRAASEAERVSGAWAHDRSSTPHRQPGRVSEAVHERVCSNTWWLCPVPWFGWCLLQTRSCTAYERPGQAGDAASTNDAAPTPQTPARPHWPRDGDRSRTHRRDAHTSPARRFAARHTPIKTTTDQLDPLPRRQPPTLALHPGR